MLITRSGSSPASRDTHVPADPVLRGQVEVGDLQHPDRLTPRGQDRHLDPAQPVGVDLVQAPVRQAARPERRALQRNLRDRATGSRHAEKATSAAGRRRSGRPLTQVDRARRNQEGNRGQLTCAVDLRQDGGSPLLRSRSSRWQTARLEVMADDSALKQRLRTDLTAAIKSRDKLRSGTLRMVLSAHQRGRGGRYARSSTSPSSRCSTWSSRRPRSGARPRRRTRTPAAPSWPRRSGPRRRCWPTTCRSS